MALELTDTQKYLNGECHVKMDTEDMIQLRSDTLMFSTEGPEKSYNIKNW